METLLVLLFALFFVTSVHCKSQENIYNDQANNQWFKDGINLAKMNSKLLPNTNRAKNVILFIGDGMGVSTTTAARIYDGQMKGQSGEENVLSWEEFPYTALSKTYNVDAQVPDSAGTATAYATGVKARKGVIGVNENVVFEDCQSSIGNEVLSILTYAELAGLSTGIVTDTRVSHATPSAFYSHSASRKWEYDNTAEQGVCKDISRQLIEYPYGDGLEVALGGGRQSFLPCGSVDSEGDKVTTGCRSDNRTLIKEWLRKYNNSEYVWNKDQLKNIDPNKTDHLLGLFASSGMAFDVEREEKNRTSEPDLTQMTTKAIEILSKNSKGFFLMVEGGEIDWGHHNGKAHLALSEAAALAKAVKSAKEMTNSDDTLIIVTADHSHSFVLYGTAKRGNPIFGLQNSLPLDGKPALTLSYSNGPGGLTNESRANLTGVNFNATDFLQQALVKTVMEDHAAEDVGIYATGPFAHLFHGVVEQNYIFHVMDYALCLTKSKQDYCAKVQPPPPPPAKCNSVNTKPTFSFSFILAPLLFLNYFLN